MSKAKHLLILGASGHGKVVADIAKLLGYSEIAFADDNPSLNSVSNCWPIVCNIDWQKIKQLGFTHLALGVGDNSLRCQWLEAGLVEGFVFPSLVHPNATVSAFCEIGMATVVMAAAVVNSDAKIAEACIINTAAVIEHDCQIARGCHVSPNACLTGGVSLQQNVWVATAASVLPGLSVAANSTIAAGAVLTQPISQAGVYAGVPAKRIKPCNR